MESEGKNLPGNGKGRADAYRKGFLLRISKSLLWMEILGR
ncbi:hypothetical protein KKC1_16210 [Calderihabitans maritimus]|uniref:Uncharacterized protein n=1 Tax=Calderihabitans maritimus TaxID=1246530 RepID=A0A1Z5HSY7_9FIRM|nr:hypothetical protein KKC1_16210 [Calderihabitans maritimus]